MSWTQSYKMPDLFDLFREILKEEGTPKEIKFPNKHIINLALHGLGWKEKIKKIEQIEVDDDAYNRIYGWKVTLSTGEVYQTVIKERYIDKNSGNYGCNYYKWEKLKKK